MSVRMNVRHCSMCLKSIEDVSDGQVSHAIPIGRNFEILDNWY
jgi:hypothetical protein